MSTANEIETGQRATAGHLQTEHANIRNQGSIKSWLI